MNTELIGQIWDQLSGKHEELVKTFYDRFFEKFPEYKPLFSDSLDRQMGKMVESMAFLARVADETEVVYPHMVKMGDKHRQFHLSKEDLEKFKEVFVEVLGEYCGGEWTSDCQRAWTEVFDQRVIPYMTQGLGNAQPRAQDKGTLKSKTSVRNQLHGKITQIKPRSYLAEVTLSLPGDDQIRAVLALESINNLGLVEGSEAHILIRAPHLILVRADAQLKFSAANRLCGKVKNIAKARLHSEITLELKGGDLLKALVSQNAADDLQIKEGDELCGIFKATNVILAVEY
jgi:molybdate transport system regulatory protein